MGIPPWVIVRRCRASWRRSLSEATARYRSHHESLDDGCGASSSSNYMEAPGALSPPTGSETASHLPTGATKFCGTWRVAESDDYESFLQHLGVTYLYRAAFAKLRPHPSYAIVDGHLQGVTLGLKDDFSTGACARSISFAGRLASVTYAWEGTEDDPELVAHASMPPDASGRGAVTFIVRRRIDGHGRLIATSELQGRRYTRIYRPVESTSRHAS
jgi:hypothetical protein